MLSVLLSRREFRLNIDSLNHLNIPHRSSFHVLIVEGEGSFLDLAPFQTEEKHNSIKLLCSSPLSFLWKFIIRYNCNVIIVATVYRLQAQDSPDSNIQPIHFFSAKSTGHSLKNFSNTFVYKLIFLYEG